MNEHNLEHNDKRGTDFDFLLCMHRKNASETILKINVLAGYLQLFVLSHKKDAKLNSVAFLVSSKK